MVSESPDSGKILTRVTDDRFNSITKSFVNGIIYFLTNSSLPIDSYAINYYNSIVTIKEETKMNDIRYVSEKLKRLVEGAIGEVLKDEDVEDESKIPGIMIFREWERFINSVTAINAPSLLCLVGEVNCSDKTAPFGHIYLEDTTIQLTITDHCTMMRILEIVFDEVEEDR